MFVTVRKHKENGQVALFTCLVTRVIHLELVDSLTNDSVIMEIRRFSARRALPEEIYSDNGFNFVGANEELKKMLENLNHSEIQRNLSVKHTKWTFIPPSTPSMNGVWE